MGDRNYGILWMIWIGMFWTCILFALPYTTFLLFELGYWWMLPILIITYVYVTAYSFFIFFIYQSLNLLQLSVPAPANTHYKHRFISCIFESNFKSFLSKL